MISLRQLRYFVKVAETGNITRAARALSVSQPSLGIQIRLLEEDLGVALLERHSRGISTTPAGDLLARKARAVLHQVEAMAEEVRSAGSVARRKVAFGVPPSLIKVIGHDLILYAQANLPDISLSIVEERSVALVRAMARDEIDYTFAFETEYRSDMWRRAILEDELVFVTAPDRAPPGRVIDLRSALEFDLAIADGRGLIRRLVEREAEKLGVVLKPTFEIHSISALQAILQEGRASGIMPYGLAVEHDRRGALACSRIETPVKRTLYVEGPSWRPSPIEPRAFDELITWAKRVLLERLEPHARSVDDSEGGLR